MWSMVSCDNIWYVTVIHYGTLYGPWSHVTRCGMWPWYTMALYVVHGLMWQYVACDGDILARSGGAEVAGWTLNQKIRVRFLTYPHRVWALWWQGGKRRLRTFRCPYRGRFGTLKTPSCPWRGCLAAGQNLETGHLSHHFIAEISLNVT